MRELEFQPDLKITAMVSMEGERVPLDTPVDPRGEANGVEVWFVQVLTSIPHPRWRKLDWVVDGEGWRPWTRGGVEGLRCVLVESVGVRNRW